MVALVDDSSCYLARLIQFNLSGDDRKAPEAG
jgi:hypothetical protein